MSLAHVEAERSTKNAAGNKTVFLYSGDTLFDYRQKPDRTEKLNYFIRLSCRTAAGGCISIIEQHIKKTQEIKK